MSSKTIPMTIDHLVNAQPLKREYSARDELETVTLVDAENNAIGSCGKIAAHRSGKMHRAFSILISNSDGELLLQRRATRKYHFARRWSNTCCGHPRPGESTMAAAERRLGTRVVDENRNWTAFVPSAARWPVDVHIYPHRQMTDLTQLTEEERDDFAVLYSATLKRLDALYDRRLPYIAGWHQAPVNRDHDLAYLHLEVLSVQRAADKMKFLAGSESGMAVWINDSTPEQIARMLREARK